MASLEYSPVCQSRNGRAVRMRCRYWCCLLVTNHQVLLLKSEFHARCWRVLFVVVNVQPADGAALPLQRHWPTGLSRRPLSERTCRSRCDWRGGPSSGSWRLRSALDEASRSMAAVALAWLPVALVPLRTGRRPQRDEPNSETSCAPSMAVCHCQARCDAKFWTRPSAIVVV